MADTDKSLYNLRYNQITSNLEAFGGGSPQWTLITLNNVDPQQVPVTRQINTTAPLQGGGNLTVDRTLSITEAGTSTDGYLSAVDWNTFNNKQTAGNYITALTGDGTATGPGSVPLTLATVNGNVGTFALASITVNAKGLITSASAGTTGSLTDVGTDGITITNGTGAVIGTGTSISQHVADTTHNGYLSSTDWNTFNNKESAVLTNTHIFVGNVSNVPTDVALSGDATLANTGALTLATVNANVGSFTAANITVNAKGLITAASNGASNVTSVSGTANQITSTGGTTPVLAIANPLTLPGAMTAGGSIAMASNNITGLANGTASTDAAAFGQIKYLQAIQATSTGSTSTSSTSFQTTGLAATIIPTSSSNRVKITVSCELQQTNAGDGAWVSVERGSTNLGTSTGFAATFPSAGSSNTRQSVGFSYIDSPATTSSTTYTVLIRSNSGGSITLNDLGITQTIILEEIV